MIRTLLIITGAAIVLCLVCLGGAAALGSRDLSRNDWTWVISDDGDNDGDFRFERGPVSPDVTRTLAWTGGQRLVVDLPVDVTYEQGPDARVTVAGPKGAVDRVRLVDGRLTLEDEDGDGEERGYIRLGRNGIHVWSESERLKITVTAPSVNSFRLAASGDLTVEGYDQPTMELLMDGSADIEADGRTGTLSLRANGSGDADLDGLEVGDATIDIAGSGDVRAGPTGAVVVDLSGSGDVDLTRRPKSLQQDLSGSGEVSGA